MPSVNDFPSVGKINAFKDGGGVFTPRGTNYELHLKVSSADVPLNVPVDVLIRVAARKVWTVPSGGNFVAPISGPPRIVQGRVRSADSNQLVVHAGANFIVDLPMSDDAIDLTEGGVGVNKIVNVTLLPGATMEIVKVRGAVAAVPEERIVAASTSASAAESPE